jgi:hypothetical protein
MRDKPDVSRATFDVGATATDDDPVEMIATESPSRNNMPSTFRISSRVPGVERNSMCKSSTTSSKARLPSCGLATPGHASTLTSVAIARRFSFGMTPCWTSRATV